MRGKLRLLGTGGLYFLPIVSGVGATAEISPAQTPPPALTAAVAGYDRAQIDGSRLGLQRYLADDYLLVNGSGDLESKSQLIADDTAPGFKLDPYVVENPVIKVWPGGAVFGGKVQLSGQSDGKRFTVHVRFSDVWRLRAGRWQVVYTQITRLGSAPTTAGGQQ